MKISDITSAIEEYAPLSLQESYDNSGMQVGDKRWEATGALLCVDVTEDIVDEAIENGINLIISHHPLLFKGIKTLTGSNYIERCIIKAASNDIAIYSAHTNMDNATKGVSCRMAEKLGLENITALASVSGMMMKITVFVPETHADTVRSALFSAGAGMIGNYDSCSYNMAGYGTFRARQGANPYCGEIGELHHENETRIEAVFPSYKKYEVVRQMQKAHPYEEPAYDIIKLENPIKNTGAGAIGELMCPMDEVDFLERIKSVFHCGILKHSALTGKKVRRVAMCGGSGSFLIEEAIRAEADVYITAEIGYHDYFRAEGDILLVDAGHYETEQYTKDIFCDIITKKFPTFAIHYTKVGMNPVNYL